MAATMNMIPNDIVGGAAPPASRALKKTKRDDLRKSARHKLLGDDAAAIPEDDAATGNPQKRRPSRPVKGRTRLADDWAIKQQKKRSAATQNGHLPPTVNFRLEKLAKGRTLGEIARGTGYKVEHISRIFNLKRTPSMRTAVAICAFLGVTLDDLAAVLRK